MIDITNIGVVPIVSIIVICFVIGQVVKLTPWNNNQFISVICLVSGGLLGALGMVLGVDYLADQNIYDAITVGVVSGGTATAVFEAGKTIKNTIKGANKTTGA